MNQPFPGQPQPTPEQYSVSPEVASNGSQYNQLPYHRNPEELARLALDTHAQPGVQDLARINSIVSPEPVSSPEASPQQVAAWAEEIAKQVLAARAPEIRQDLEDALKRGN